jgi:hypothetical protein
MTRVFFAGLGIVILLLSVAAIDHASAEPAASPYRYSISFGEWDGKEMEDWERIPVFVNGKDIGTPKVAFPMLEKLPVISGEHVRIDGPPFVRGEPYRRPVYVSSNFIQIWQEKQVLIDLFEGGKKANLHTVTWTDFCKNGVFIDNLDDATWVVDGKGVGKGPALIKALEKIAGEHNPVILWMTPLGFVPFDLIEHGDASRHIDALCGAGRIRRIGIQPDRADSKKYRDEKLMHFKKAASEPKK